MKAENTQFKSSDLFVIVTDWFDNPFEDNVYTNIDEANQLAGAFNDSKVTSSVVANVMSVSDYYDHIRDKQSQSDHYSNQKD